MGKSPASFGSAVAWSVLRRFWPKIQRQLPLLSGALLAMLGEIVLRLLEPWPLKLIFDQVIAGQPADVLGGVTILAGLDATVLLALAALAVMIIAAFRAGASYLSTVGVALAGNRVLGEVREELYGHLLRLSLSYHDRARSGDLITRLVGDVGRLQEVAVTAVLPVLVHSLTLLAMLALMLWLNWRLALVALTAFPLLSLSMVRVSGRIHQVAQDQRRREGALAASAAEAIVAVRAVKALTLERILEQAFARQNRKSWREGVQGRRLAARLERSVDLLIALGTSLVLWQGTRLVLAGSLTPGDLLVFLSYLKGAFRPTRDLAKYSGRIAKASAAGERVLAVLDTEPQVQDLPGAREAPALRGRVVFEDVRFAYQPGHPVLHQINLCIEPGQHVALVGPSGSGKSTLLSLILRLYDPVDGRITVDGHDIRSFTIASLRAQVGVVLQDSVLFAVSVRDNIAYGRPQATEQEIEAAARLANAHDFIKALPQGYHTVLGERGATLSGGQRQRIAIARMAVRQAAILLLDEPASGLDRHSHQQVLESLAHATARRTTISVAHDLSTITGADQILHLEGGRILERGTHAQLMAQDGPYRALFRLQEHALHAHSC